MNGAQTPRQAWAAAFRQLLETGAWIGDKPRPTGDAALIKAFAARMVGEQDCPSAPDKAVATWLHGSAPFSKTFDLICLVAFGTSSAIDPRRVKLQPIWQAARASPKQGMLDTEPARRPATSKAPATMSELAWATSHAWQTLGLATLYVDQLAPQNERDSYSLRISVSFGTDQFTIDRSTFSVGLTDAWLEPEYRYCHPVPGTAPGESGPHDCIAFGGGRYQFKGPKPDGQLLYGNPFGATPFAEITWDRPGANEVMLTLASQRTALEITQTSGAKLKPAKLRLIQHYLRVKQSKTDAGTVQWARAAVRGRVRE